MAIVSMVDAVPGAVASSAEYNKLIDNIQDIDGRLGAVVASPSANTRLGSLETITASGTSGNSALNTRLGIVETLTTDTATNGGQGNSRLADRFGTGVGIGSNVTTGSATSQLTDLRSRTSALESSSGTGAIVSCLRPQGTASVAVGAGNFVSIPWASAPRNPNALWSAGQPTRVTVTATGLYRVCTVLVFRHSDATGGLRSGRVYINGVNTIRTGGPWVHQTGNFTEVPVDTFVELTAGNYIEVQAFSSSATEVVNTVSPAAGDTLLVVKREA